MERRELEEMPFDRLILWVDEDGVEREHWIHATGFEYLNSRGIWKTEFVFPDGSIG